MPAASSVIATITLRTMRAEISMDRVNNTVTTMSNHTKTDDLVFLSSFRSLMTSKSVTSITPAISITSFP